MLKILLLIASISFSIAASFTEKDFEFDSSFGTEEVSKSSENFNCARLPPAYLCASEKIQSECGNAKFCADYKAGNWNKPVQVTLLYESLCPYCQRLIVNELSNLVKGFNKTQIDLELVPYGNARKAQNGTISCQHGPEECKINKYESCVINFVPDPLPFIVCLEGLLANRTSFDNATRKCHSKAHTSPHIFGQIMRCFKGDLGNTLQAQAAERTDSVWPDKHSYVPWILVNNASLANRQFIRKDLKTLICLTYIGDKIPEPCIG